MKENEKQIEEMAKAKKCNACIHNAVCEKLEEFRDPLGWVNTENEFYCSYYRKQKEGEWLTDRYGMERSICSVCGAVYEGDGGNYCPNCGAKMKGGAE